MKSTKLTLLLIFLILDCSLVLGQNERPQKVLFVGNSYTYFWNLPQHVHLMAKDQKMEVTTGQSTAGGSHWGHHWKGQRGLTSLDKIRNGNHDIVVIQNHSRSAIDTPDSLMHYGILLANEIKKSGAQPMLYMTWSREWDPFMIEQISEKYQELGKAINAPVAPVGLAFDLARKLRPEMKLYSADGSHQNALGTYLASCVFFAMITKKSPLGITPRLVTRDAKGEKLYINLQSDEDALFCQKVAERVVNDFID